MAQNGPRRIEVQRLEAVANACRGYQSIAQDALAVVALAKTETALRSLQLRQQAAAADQHEFADLKTELARHTRHAQTVAVAGVARSPTWRAEVANMYSRFVALLTRTDPEHWEELPPDVVEAALSTLPDMVREMALNAMKSLESSHEVMQKVADSMTTL
jgi:hypothetical protein